MTMTRWTISTAKNSAGVAVRSISSASSAGDWLEWGATMDTDTTRLPVSETGQFTSPILKTSHTDRTQLGQVADTLDFCRIQVRLSSKIIEDEYEGGNHSVMLLWHRVNDAWSHLERALSELHSTHNTDPREPVPGAADA